MSTCSKKSSRIICICCYTFYAASMNIKKVKWKKMHIAGWTQKSPGRGRFSEKNRPGAPGILYGFAFASSNGVISLPAGDFPSFGGLGVPPEVVASVWGASCRKSLPPFGGRPAGSCYLRWGASCRKSLPPFWEASCRKLLPPLGGRPAGSRYLRWGRPAGSCYLRLGGVPPEGIPLLGEGASRSGYFVFCEMPVMRLMTKSCCSSVTTLSQ